MLNNKQKNVLNATISGLIYEINFMSQVIAHYLPAAATPQDRSRYINLKLNELKSAMTGDFSPGEYFSPERAKYELNAFSDERIHRDVLKEAEYDERKRRGVVHPDEDVNQIDEMKTKTTRDIIYLEQLLNRMSELVKRLCEIYENPETIIAGLHQYNNESNQNSPPSKEDIQKYLLSIIDENQKGVDYQAGLSLNFSQVRMADWEANNNNFLMYDATALDAVKLQSRMRHYDFIRANAMLGGKMTEVYVFTLEHFSNFKEHLNNIPGDEVINGKNAREYLIDGFIEKMIGTAEQTKWNIASPTMTMFIDVDFLKYVKTTSQFERVLGFMLENIKEIHPSTIKELVDVSKSGLGESYAKQLQQKLLSKEVLIAMNNEQIIALYEQVKSDPKLMADLKSEERGETVRSSSRFLSVAKTRGTTRWAELLDTMKDCLFKNAIANSSTAKKNLQTMADNPSAMALLSEHTSDRKHKFGQHARSETIMQGIQGHDARAKTHKVHLAREKAMHKALDYANERAQRLTTDKGGPSSSPRNST